MPKIGAPISCRSLSKFALLALICLSACAHSPPREEWVYAQSALDAARQVGANRFAPSLWFHAEDSYKRAQKYYEDGQFKEAQIEFLKARNYAERAENVTRLKRFEKSEVL